MLPLVAIPAEPVMHDTHAQLHLLGALRTDRIQNRAYTQVLWSY